MITLYKRDKKGTVTIWKGWSKGPELLTEYGIEGGKMQHSSKLATPKNIGKANETSPEEQARLEIESIARKKEDQGYVKDKANLDALVLLPMLATSIEKVKELAPTMAIQRKYNGVRCLAHLTPNGVQLLSRRGKVYSVPHIEKFLFKILARMPKGTVLDGELYTHGLSLSSILSLVTKFQKKTKLLRFMAYDMFNMFNPECWQDREAHLAEFFGRLSNTGPLIHVPTGVCDTTQDQHRQLAKEYEAEGFEGAILRDFTGTYELGSRSRNLLKVKFFIDAEFKIINIVDGRGKGKGQAIFELVTKDGLPFRAVPKATEQERRDMFQFKAHFIGAYVTVRFQEYTDLGIPHQPRAINFRPLEDM